MKTTTCLFVLAIAAASLPCLTACSKSATVTGQGGTKLTLYKPGSVTLHRGGMAKADIKLKRNDLAGEVSIRFSDLPAGVDVVDENSRILGDDGSYTLRASESAALVENTVAQVTATGPDGIAVTTPITITVKEKNPQ